MKKQETLFEMPFNLIQDQEQDGARIQEELDKQNDQRIGNEKAQRIFFVTPGGAKS